MTISIDDYSPNTCSICLEDILKEGVTALVCAHVFHEICIEPWLRRADTCPICLTNVKNLTSLSGHALDANADPLSFVYAQALTREIDRMRYIGELDDRRLLREILHDLDFINELDALNVENAEPPSYRESLTRRLRNSRLAALATRVSSCFRRHRH